MTYTGPIDTDKLFRYPHGLPSVTNPQLGIYAKFRTLGTLRNQHFPEPEYCCPQLFLEGEWR